MWLETFFEPQWKVSLTPSGSTTTWETILDLIDADLVARNPVILITAARSPADVPLEWLPYLAAERSVDEFSSAWPEVRQRAVVKASFSYHQHKGTRRALDEALLPLGYQVRVVEWFEAEPARRAYTFRLRVMLTMNDEWTVPQRTALLRVANAAKNAHTKIEAISLVRPAPPAAVYVGGVVRRRRRICVGQIPKPTHLKQTSHVFMGAIVSTRRRTIILPRRS